MPKKSLSGPEKLIGVLTGRLAYSKLKGIVTDSRFKTQIFQSQRGSGLCK
jgi:hypothetical protein